MTKKCTLQETDEPAVASEPAAVGYAQPSTMHVNLTYDIPQRIDITIFRNMMDSYAMDLINAPENTELTKELSQRLVLAVQDVKEGRTLSSEEVHKNLEGKYPWLCE